METAEALDILRGAIEVERNQHGAEDGDRLALQCVEEELRCLRVQLAASHKLVSGLKEAIGCDDSLEIGKLIRCSIEKDLGPERQAEHERQIAMIRSVEESVYSAISISGTLPPAEEQS